MTATEVRLAFSDAAVGFVTVVSGMGRDDWSRPGLGEWTVLDLVGHTGRALSTIETYLGSPPGEIDLHDPQDYLLAITAPGVDPAAIAARGRAAGAALGDDPAAAIAELAERVTTLVAATADDALVSTAVGCATLLTYLPTRTFELTVHTLDLARALELDPPAILATPIAACLELAAAAASARPDAAVVLRALTGRGVLPSGFSVV